MKRYLTVLLNIFIFFFCPIMIAQGAQVIVNLDNPPQSGSIVFLLFDSADTFGDFSDYTKKLKFTSDGRKIFQLKEGEIRAIDIEFFRPLGKFGRLLL
jgi:hypothetical protein